MDALSFNLLRARQTRDKAAREANDIRRDALIEIAEIFERRALLAPAELPRAHH